MSKPITTREIAASIPLQTRSSGAITRLAPADDDAAAADAGKAERRYRVTASTGASVKRWGYTPESGYGRYLEELVISKEAIDMGRLADGAPLLDSHSAWALANLRGHTENPKIEDGELRCDIVLPPAGIDEEIDRAAALIEAGTIRFVSLGYTQDVVEVIQGRDGALPIHRVTRWTPMELSLVAVPADAGAQVQRSEQAEGGTTLRTFPVTFVQPTADPQPQTARRSNNQEKDSMSKPDKAGDPAETIENEAVQRAADPAPPAPAAALTAREALSLRSQAVGLGVKPEDADSILTRDGVTAASAREAILAKASERSISQPRQDARIDVLRDENETAFRAAETAILQRANPQAVDRSTAEGREALSMAAEYRGMSLLETFRHYAQVRHGARLIGFSRRELATLALGLPDSGLVARAGMSTSDFPIILANVASRRMRDAYAAVQMNWTRFCRQSNAPDFKTKDVIALSGLPTFEKVVEGAEYKYAKFGEGKESYALATYGKVVAITRQALINDDLGAFNRLPEMIGRAAAELQNDIVWGIFLNNPNMADGQPLFHASHANLGTAADVTEASIQEIERLMLEQKDASGKTPYNLRPAYLIVTPKRKVAAQKLLASVTAAKTGDVNVYQNAMDLIVEARLKPAAGNEPWFVVGEPGALDTIEYAYLDGEQGLYTETRNGFEIDGMEIKGRVDFAAKAIDHRNMAKNAGIA